MRLLVPPETHPVSIPQLLHNTIGICLRFRMFQTVFNKLHEHSHTGIKITYNFVFNITTFLTLKNGYLFLYLTVSNVNMMNTLI